MRCWRLVLCAAVAGLAAAGGASADVGFHVDQASVRVGGLLTGSGDGSGMPVFVVPVAVAPRPFACGRNAICTPRSSTRPGPPLYTYLGAFRRTHDLYAMQRFRFRVPQMRPGVYKVVVWCRVCKGSLILAGTTIAGQTVRVR